MGTSQSSQEFSTDAIPDLSGKVAIITGGTAGLGLSTAVELARKGAHVIITARSQSRGEEALQTIKEELSAKEGAELKIEFGIADNRDLKSIKAFVAWFLARNLPLHILMLNAGVAFVPFELIDGVESTLLINHVSHHLLAQLLLNKLRESAPSRVVVVSSDSHLSVKSLDLETPTPETYSAWKAYGYSKLANILFTKALQKRLASADIYVNALHPGTIATNIHTKVAAPDWIKPAIGGVMKLAFPNTSHGALTQLYLATSPEVETRGYKGQYFFPVASLRPKCTPAAEDEASAERLWEWTEGRVQEILR